MSIEFNEWSKYPLWIDAYNVKHNIEDMSDRYINSCINLLKKNGINLSAENKQEFLKAFEEEMKQRKS